MSQIIVSQHETAKGTPRGYFIGYLGSILLTLIAFSFVYIHVHSPHQTFSHLFLIPLVIVLALVQLTLQLIYFLHVGKSAKPRYNLLALAFAAIVVLILVLGSLWIMYSLNYRMMTPSQINNYINSQDGL